jgi:hypothetical protein
MRIVCKTAKETASSERKKRQGREQNNGGK